MIYRKWRVFKKVQKKDFPSKLEHRLISSELLLGWGAESYAACCWGAV